MTKPIIKWSGRKSYLTPYIDDYLIKLDKKNFKYFEPFLGSGAIFFHLANKNLINKSVDPYKLIKGFWENNKK